MNTCLKGVQSLRLQAGESVLVMGQGPIGVMLAALCRRAGARVIASDLHPQRLTISKHFGIAETIDASVKNVVETTRALTDRRGADAVIVAVGGNGLIRPAMDAVRPGGRVMLFAQTVRSEAAIDPAAICVDEKTLMGSYSASVDIQEETVELVFNGGLDLESLITHRFPLSEAVEAIKLASNPQPDSMKIVIQPGRE